MGTGNLLNGVTLQSSLNVGSASAVAAMTITNGLTLDHAAGEALTLFVPAGASQNPLVFNTGTLGAAAGKTGSVVLTPVGNSNLNLLINNGNALTVGPGVTLKAANGGAGSATNITGNTGTVLNNQGTIASETTGRTLTIRPATTNNTGTLAANNGGILTLGGTWHNAGGTFSLDANAASTLNLGGSFTTADLGTFSRGVNGLNGVVNLTGTLTNTGTTLLLNNTTGSLNLFAGDIIGGVIDTAAGSSSVLNVVGTTGNQWSGVTLKSSANVGGEGTAAHLSIVNGLTLDQEAGESLTVFTPANTAVLALTFNTGTLGAAPGKVGTVALTAGTNSNALSVQINTNQALTIGPGVTVKAVGGGAGSVTRITGNSGSSLLNQGAISSETASRTFIVAADNFTNGGALAAKNGGILTVVSNASNLTNLASGVLTGGTYQAFANSTLSFGTATFTTNAATILLDGVGSVFAAVNPLATNNGSFTIQNGRNFTTVGALTNGGTLGIGPSSTLNITGALTNNNHIVMNGGTLDATGTNTNNAPADITGFGTLNDTVLNHGLVRASGGNLLAGGGIDGQSGTIQVDPGATLTLAANSDGDFLINNGTLALGSVNLTVAQDYTNANFGTGNTFNARTNVTGTGQILAAGDSAQAITGQVTGAGPNVTMTFGNVHVGEVNARTYQVANTGSTGPSLRGAIQTTINGGNLTDARLSGSGVTAGNFGPIAVGTNSGDRTVTFTATTGGALTGQVLNIANNFDNVADSEIAIVNSAAFRFANPTAHTPEPIVFANRHVGDAANQVLSITNNVPNDGFSEALNATFSAITGKATTNGGSFNLLAPGATNSTSLSVGLSTGDAGANSGTVEIALTSNGAGASGLGLTALAPQTVNVSGNVFRFADSSSLTPNTVSLGNRHVGDVAEQTLLLSNLAANDSFSESLNAAFGTLTGNATASGSVNLLAAGANSSALKVGINTATAGNKTGSAAVNFVSDGSGTSALGQTALNGTGNTVNEQQVVNVSGTVFRLATASAHTPEPVTLANARVGGASTQALTLTNTAANDSFSEKLNATLSGATSGLTATGSFNLLDAQATNNTSLVIGLDTASAGHKAGTATINLTSDGAGTSGLGTTGLVSQTVNASGNVFRLASASAHTPEPVTLANARVGGTSTQALSLTNTAANDTFSEKLNASLSGATTGITATGNIALLGAQATNSANLVVGLDTVSAGHKAGTATLNLASDGTGTSGFSALDLTAQTVNVAGNVFRLASASAHSPEPVAFGNRHVGDVVSQALTLSNTAANDGFSERLNASIGGATGAATTNGASFLQLAAGAPADTSLAVGLNTSSAGAKSGAATITLASDGTGTSGFGALGIGTQTVNVTGAVFRLAQANAVGALNFGNVHVGDVLSQALTIQNLAAADGFSESLNASFGASSDARILTSGSITQLAAGGLNNTSMFIGLNTSAAGLVDGTVGLNLASDGFGSSGLGVTALDSQVINVDALITEAAVFRLANAQILNSQPIDFGKHRVGDVVGNIGLNLKNAVPADGFSESLNASAAGASAGFTASGAFSGLVADATNNGSLAVGISTAAAGHKVGTAQIDLVSDGTGTSGLGLTALPGQEVNLVGDIYRLAVGSTAANVNVGNAHVGDTLSKALSVTNSATNDGFSEALNASFSGTSGAASAVGVINLLAAGSTDTANMVVDLDTATAGAKIGSTTVNFTSDGTGSSGFGALAAGSQIVNLTGGVFGFAVAQSSTSDLDFAARRVGDVADSLVLTISNASANDGFHEGLDATYGSLPAAFQTSGNTTINNLAAGASADATVTLSTVTAGNFVSTLSIDATSNGTLSGLADTALAPVAVNVSGKVYAQAVADVQTSSINYGIVHKNEVVAARTITVQNDASGALTDVLNGSVSASGAFSGAGTLSELAAGQTNTNSLSVALDTSAAGVFFGNATVALVSHNPDMLDLSLGSTLVALSAQVNEFASPVFTQTGGDGVLGVSNGTDFLLNFGTVQQGSVELTSVLQVANDVSVPADTLRVELVGATSHFGLTGFGTFEILAGDSHALSISFNPLTAGLFDDLISLNLFGFNASGFDQQLGSFKLNLQGNILPSAVPLPAGVWLLGSALVGLVGARRRATRVLI